jgi:hypothetical protein
MAIVRLLIFFCNYLGGAAPELAPLRRRTEVTAYRVPSAGMTIEIIETIAMRTRHASRRI